jgi:hypothetical protein
LNANNEAKSSCMSVSPKVLGPEGLYECPRLCGHPYFDTQRNEWRSQSTAGGFEVLHRDLRGSVYFPIQGFAAKLWRQVGKLAA